MTSYQRPKSGGSRDVRTEAPSPSARPSRTYRPRRNHDLQTAFDRLSRLDAERQAILERFPDLDVEARHLPNGDLRRWHPRQLRRYP